MAQTEGARQFLIDPEKVDISNASEWAEATAAPSDRLRWDVLEGFHNQAASDALARAVFDWHRIASDENIDKMQDEYFDEQPVRFYLAEDTSRFVGKDALTRYRADFHNFGDRRGIENLERISYGPQRRMRFG